LRIKSSAIGVIGLLAVSSPVMASDQLSPNARVFVEAFVGAYMVVNKCGATVVKDSALRLGDLLGVDGANLGRAVKAAIHAVRNVEYERSDLIPEVTEMTMSAIITISDDVTKDRQNCSKWIDVIRKTGLVQ
jgi:hypothetical protein